MAAEKNSFVYSWLAGAALLLALCFTAGAWLWSAARASAAGALEAQVSAVLAGDLAEGNLFKLGASLARLRQAGSLEYAEIRSFSAAGGWEKVFATGGAGFSAEGVFENYACARGRAALPRAGGGVGLVTTLPSNLAGADCVALLLASDLPAELKLFRNRLGAAFALLSALLVVLFLRLTMAWHKKELALEVAARTAEAEKEAALGRMAAQVAHDIRSPLAALDAALDDLRGLPAEKRELVRGALGRIGGIAAGLLGTYKGGVPPSRQDLKRLAEAVLAEKRAQYAARPELVFAFTCSEARLYAVVQPEEFQRLVSNLLNNAAEALEKGGRVSMRLYREAGRVCLQVSDDGKGIPAELLAKLGRKGETHGKAGGTGLGLYHARTTAENCGGVLSIDSKPGAGASVTVALPEAASPAAPRMAVLIDDDALVRLTWKAAARAAGAELRLYASPEEFYAAQECPKDAAVFIDSDLGGGVKGEAVAEALKARGYTELRLETGHPPEKFAHLPWLTVQGKEPPWGA